MSKKMSLLRLPPSVNVWGGLVDLCALIKVLGHAAFSRLGWLCLAIVAPLLWGLLPLGYDVLNSNPIIDAERIFTVFMRTLLASIVSLGLLGVWLLVLFLWGAMKGDAKWIWIMLKVTCRKIWKYKWWLIALPTGYFFARFFEMKFILHYAQDAVDNSVISETAAKALRSYGYYMGLLLIILFPKKSPKDFSLVEALVWICSLLMVFASGILNLSARCPVGVWEHLGGITVWAALVAFICAVYTFAKINGNLLVSAEDDKIMAGRQFRAALTAALVMNLIMCSGAAALAYLFWSGSHWLAGHVGTATGKVLEFDDLWVLYMDGWLGKAEGFRAFFLSNGFWLVWIVVVLGTIVAPVCQLAGVSLHDAVMKKKHMEKFGLSGGDWLVVCGGFEPMFVVIVGCTLVPYLAAKSAKLNSAFGQTSFVSILSIVMAFALVIGIALLRIIKIWSAKNSALRNAIFADKRGSSRGPAPGTNESALLARAEELAFLKFYDKRRELENKELSLSEDGNGNDWARELKGLNSNAVVAAFIQDYAQFTGNSSPMRKDCRLSPGLNLFYVFLKGGEDFFTQDDPFTSNVLSAQFDWLRKRHSDVEVTSFSYSIKKYCNNSDEWKDLKLFACDNDKTATPFLLLAKTRQEANAFCEDWANLLYTLKHVASNGNISQYVAQMILTYKET
ncbi:MAG: hypothetical protein IJG18_01855 [Kiritimatiellae bacterium]|nr:hypothetical protein [Kiritimatiellia bacterium]